MTASRIVIVALRALRHHPISLLSPFSNCHPAQFHPCVSHRPIGKLGKTVFFVTTPKIGTFAHRFGKREKVHTIGKRLFPLDWPTSANLRVKTVKINGCAVILRGMRGDTSSPQIDGSDEAWSEIESLVDETSKLARLPMSSREFHGQLIKRLVQATDAHAAAIWCRDKDAQYSIQAQIESPRVTPGNGSLLSIRSQNVIEIARRRRQSSLLAHQAAVELENPTDDALVLQPAMVDDQIVAVVEVFHDNSVSPTQAKNIRQLITVFADLVAEFHQNCQLRDLRNRETAWSELEQFVDQVHQTLDLKRTGFAITNEAARVTGCDRVMVFHGHNKRFRALSISGLDSFDRRSTQVRGAEKLAITSKATVTAISRT